MPFFVVQAPASSTSGDIVQSKTFSCLASAAVDDLVRISTSTNSFVDVVANNLGSKPVGVSLELLLLQGIFKD